MFFAFPGNEGFWPCRDNAVTPCRQPLAQVACVPKRGWSMSGSSEQKEGVLRYQMGFIVRLFAAWAAISLIAGIGLFPVTTFLQSAVGDIYVAGSQDRQGVPLMQFAVLFVCYFWGGYFALGFFRESWLKVGLGIPLMNYANIIWLIIWDAILGPMFEAKLLGTLEVISVIYFLSPMVITVGVLTCHLLPPGQIRPRTRAVVRRLRQWPYQD